MKRLALGVGLTRLDPAAYDGWDGDCPGCDRDAAKFIQRCHDVGFDGVAVLVNSMATKFAISQNFIDMVEAMESGDLMVLYCSGHGGQKRDTNGDETDKWDETLCWWDGEVTDDTIAQYLDMVPDGARVLYVTDTCNSGTNYRGRPVAQKNDPKPHISLLHFGGCDDGRYSYGGEKGGHFTLAMIDALSDARKPITYREWFDRTVLRMYTHQQRPVVSEYGETFLNWRALT